MKQIGRYRIVSELGRGAMGVVYRAHDPQIDREIALKTIRLATHADPSEIKDMRGRLIREAQSAGRLSHPGIVTIFDAGEQDGLAYVAMELVEGRSLHEILAGPVLPDRKLEFLVALLEKAGSALDYASANGVVHRDVKPANIMVSGPSIKLLDFGVARVASAQATRAGTVFGTPNYMSPEQVQGRQVDGRADQFSLGVIAYEVLSGVKPFEAPAIPSTLYKIVHDDPEPLRTFLPDISASLERVVLRALQKSPEDRFESCEEFALAFADAAGGLAGLGPAISPGSKTGQPDVDGTLDSRTAPNADPAESTSGDRDWSSLGGQGLPVRDRTQSQGPPNLPARTGAPGPGRDASEPILPVGETSAEAVETVARPKPRWPNLIFALLILAIGALALLLVRYPGLLDDPRTLMDAILGTTPIDRNAPSTKATVPTVPAADASDQAESQFDDDPDPLVGTLESAPQVVDGQDEQLDGAQPRASSTSDDELGPSEVSLQPPVVPPAAPSGGQLTIPQVGVAFFRSPVAGVVVALDGNRDWRCVTPCQLNGLPLGEHKLVARRDGYSELHRTIRISEAALNVILPMERIGAVLLVSSEPADARIILDGRDTGQTTNARLTVSPGKHAVRLVLGRLSAERSIEVAENETRYLQFRLGTQ